MAEKDRNPQPPLLSSSPSKPSVSSFPNNLEGFEAWLKAGADPLPPPQPKPLVPSSPPPQPPRSSAPPEAQVGSSVAPPALARSSAPPVGSSAHARALALSSTLPPPRALVQSSPSPRTTRLLSSSTSKPSVSSFPNNLEGFEAWLKAGADPLPPPQPKPPLTWRNLAHSDMLRPPMRSWAPTQPLVPSSPPPRPPRSSAPPEAQVGSSAAPPTLARSSAPPVGSSAHARALARSSTLPPPRALAQSWAPRPSLVQSSPSPKTTRSSARVPVRSSALPQASQRRCVLDWPPSMKGFNEWIEVEENNRAASDQDQRSASELLEDAYNAFMAPHSRKRLKFIRSAIEPEEATIKQESASVAVFDAIEYVDAAVIRRNEAIVELLRLRKAARRRFLAVKLGLPICLYRVVESDIIRCISWNNADSFVISNESILFEFIKDGYFGNVRSVKELKNSLLDHGFTAAGTIFTHIFGKFVRGHPELLEEIKHA
ncbi:unnamed protein product [Prunus brigantina]